MAKNNDNKNLISSKYSGAGISTRKIQPVANQIRGKGFTEVVNLLAFSNLKAARIINEVVQSAYSNMRNLKPDVKEENVLVKDINVGPGPTRKWGRPGGKGSVKPIRKRSTHIRVLLSEKEGLNNE